MYSYTVYNFMEISVTKCIFLAYLCWSVSSIIYEDYKYHITLVFVLVWDIILFYNGKQLQLCYNLPTEIQSKMFIFKT
jgi:hypothetical protein